MRELANLDAVGEDAYDSGSRPDEHADELERWVHGQTFYLPSYHFSSQHSSTFMTSTVPIEFKNMSHEPGKGYYVGYLKGKRKKYVEQEERYETPEEALKALNLKSDA